MTQTYDSKNFETEVLQSQEPVLVDFWAEWCGPCKAIGPLIDQLSAKVEGSAKVGKVNVDQAPELASKYGIQSIPSLLIFRDGEVSERLIGANVTVDLLESKLQAQVSF